MNHRMPIVALLCFSILATWGCAKKGDGTETTMDNALYSAIRNTTPAFRPAGTAVLLGSKNQLGSVIKDDAMLSAYKTLQDFKHPEDEGKVDTTSIHKVMYEAGRYLDDAPSYCTTKADLLDSAISPFAFGADFLGHTYNCGGTVAEGSRQYGYGQSAAYQVTGNIKHALLTYKWAPDSSGTAVGAFQVSWDTGTNDLTINFAQSVKGDSSTFGLRTWISGNSTTHTFSIRTASSTNAGIVGAGVSQGTGKYFLIKSGTSYYCIPAGSDETALAAITSTTAANISANCAEFKTAVDALVPYNYMTDVPKIDLTDFDHAVAGTPVKYLMF